MSMNSFQMDMSADQMPLANTQIDGFGRLDSGDLVAPDWSSWNFGSLPTTDPVLLEEAQERESNANKADLLVQHEQKRRVEEWSAFEVNEASERQANREKVALAVTEEKKRRTQEWLQFTQDNEDESRRNLAASSRMAMHAADGEQQRRIAEDLGFLQLEEVHRQANQFQALQLESKVQFDSVQDLAVADLAERQHRQHNALLADRMARTEQHRRVQDMLFAEQQNTHERKMNQATALSASETARAQRIQSTGDDQRRVQAFNKQLAIVTTRPRSASATSASDSSPQAFDLGIDTTNMTDKEIAYAKKKKQEATYRQKCRDQLASIREICGIRNKKLNKNAVLEEALLQLQMLTAENARLHTRVLTLEQETRSSRTGSAGSNVNDLLNFSESSAPYNYQRSWQRDASGSSSTDSSQDDISMADITDIAGRKRRRRTFA